ncbi:NAD(P)-binding protein [Mollisia scopiformis]|uniref:NAD(P)-binding protein n=1 Tax=Mollisia scopiformis TaxID=149040 RepID=A0A194WYE0_MOLSC|nr:NAD(P)-binding protein [Mollisia scopiformis]KUJ12955.1 NAD(P)-binding protein [Mollisia scopiformis]
MNILSTVKLSDMKASNSRLTSDTAPRIAVFVGATSGIGKATLTRLVAQQTALKVYVVGRNAEKQKSFINQLQQSNEKAQIIFIEGEISLMADTKRIYNEIKSKERSIDALFLSAGYIPWGGREKTSERIDTFSALAYYGRILFILNLLPLLKASPHSPRIVALGGAGLINPNLFLEDLDLDQLDHYTMRNTIDHVATCSTFTLSHLADENPDVVFVFANPGLVVTDIYNHGWGGRIYLRMFVGLIKPLMRMFAVPAEDAGERCLYLLTSARFGRKGAEEVSRALTMKKAEEGGLFCVTWKVESVFWETFLTEEQRQELEEKAWAKAQEVLKPYL